MAVELVMLTAAAGATSKPGTRGAGLLPRIGAPTLIGVCRSRVPTSWGKVDIVDPPASTRLDHQFHRRVLTELG